MTGGLHKGYGGRVLLLCVSRLQAEVCVLVNWRPLTPFLLCPSSCVTGSAAIYGLRGKKNINVFMLYPKGRVSDVQEKQMTTVLDDNVHCIAVEVRHQRRLIHSQQNTGCMPRVAEGLHRGTVLPSD